MQIGENQKKMSVNRVGSPSSAGIEDNRKWYVLHTYSGQEKSVQRSLQHYIDREKLEHMFGGILVPTEEIVELRAGKKRTTDRVIYPGYVFINMEMTPQTWHLVKSIPHISSLLGGRDPTPISNEEAQVIMDLVEAGVNNPRPKFTYSPGEVVRIIDGPFEEFNGTVEDVNYERDKLRVTVTLFGRSTPVELDFSQVQKG